MNFITQGSSPSLNRRVQYWSHRLFESFILLLPPIGPCGMVCWPRVPPAGQERYQAHQIKPFCETVSDKTHRKMQNEGRSRPSHLYISQSQASHDTLPRAKDTTIYLDWPRHVLVSIVYPCQESPMQGFPSPRRQSQRWTYVCHRQRSKLHVGSTAPLRLIDSLAIPAHLVEGVMKSSCVL